MSSKLKAGDKAPDFEAQTYGGEKLRLSEFYNNSSVLLYFYPKDNTPGCTKQACSLRDGMDALKDLDIQVIGVSTDGVKAHENFRDKYGLNFPLASDKDKEIVEQYGVKSAFGSAKRVSFLIEKGGNIKKVWDKVNTSEHAREVVDYIKNAGS